MEEIKEKPNKIHKLKINSDSTLEDLSSQLEQSIQAKEINIFVTLCHNLRDHFLLINQSLSPQQLLKKLVINFRQIKTLKFEDSIFLLNNLNQIVNLSLQFSSDTFSSLQQNTSLSNCLLQFKSLTSFEISISGKMLKNKESVFQLANFFKETPHLSSLIYHISYVPEYSTLYYELMEGIKYLKNLKCLSVSADMSKVKSFLIIDLLEEQLKEHTQITEFSLDFGYKTVITNHDFHKIGMILIQQQCLEKLKLSSYYSIKKQFFENIKLEDNILALRNLKELNLTFNRELYLKFENLFEKIALLNNLEKVVIDLFLLTKEQVNQDILSLGKSLAKISNLTELKITFDYEFPLSIVESIKFMIELYPLRKLNSLQIYLNSMINSKYDIDIDIDIERFKDLISRLKIFHFKKNAEINQREDNNFNNIFESLKSANLLEELNAQFNNYFSKSSFKKQTISSIDFLENKTSLKILNLNFDFHIEFHENQLFSIFQGLKQNLKLSEIHLTFKNQLKITEREMKELNENLIRLNDLTILDLQFDPQILIDDSGMQYLSNSLIELKSLQTLTLIVCKDNISSKTLNHLITSISQMQKLRTLTLTIHGTSFDTDEEQTNFGNCFDYQPKFKFLDITLKIPGLKYRCLENMFKKVSSLKKIRTMRFFFQFETVYLDWVKIAEYCSNLNQLEVLGFNSFSFHMLYLLKLFDSLPLLSYIDFMDEYKEINCIVKSYKKIKEYEGKNEAIEKIKLKIQTNEFFLNETYEREIASTTVPVIIQNIIRLTKLKLYFCKNNQIGSDYSCLIYNNLRVLQNLEHLQIHIEPNNQIGSYSINRLGESLLQLPFLRRLSVIINQIENNIEWIDCSLFFNCLGKLLNLEYLETTLIYQENSMYEEIENEEAADFLFKDISNLTKLKTLSLTLDRQFVTQIMLNQFNSMCRSLAHNLRKLSIYLFVESEDIFRSIKQSIRKLECLQDLQTNSRYNDLHKVKRLVNYKKLEYFGPVYDYY